MAIDETENEEYTEIKIVRLISGEELIGEVTEYTSNDVQKVLIEKPALVVLQRPTTAQDQVGIALYNWLPYTTAEKEGVVVEKNNVVFIVTPEEGLTRSYRERFSLKGLVLPGSGKAGLSSSGLILP
jgi:hypothetical protein